jgi:acyl-CoA dehydrogenase
LRAAVQYCAVQPRIKPEGRSAIRLPERSMGSAKNQFQSRAEIVATAAAESAADVDRGARFPQEAFTAARQQRLLGMLVPASLGGEQARVSDVVDVCYTLGRSCASTAMIFAMHQIMVAILVRHAREQLWHRNLLRRIADEQLLLASSTTEGQGGGDLRTSSCAVQQAGSRISLIKEATVVSYGAQADAILTTARRTPDAPPSDQVLVAFLKDSYQLETITTWDTLGMRGTCSPGVVLKGRGEIDQVLPEPYHIIHTHTMMPVAHLTWSAVWCGVAADAFDRTRRFARRAARGSGGQPPPGAAHLTRANMSLRMLRAIVACALQRFEAAGPEDFDSLDFQNAMNLLKVNASETAIATVMSCMQACGLTGYRNDGDFSIARNVRDILSTSIMINNDRIVASAGTASMVIGVPPLLSE